MVDNQYFACYLDYLDQQCFVTAYTLTHFVAGISLGGVAFVLLRRVPNAGAAAFVLAYFVHLLYELKDYLGTYGATDHPARRFNQWLYGKVLGYEETVVWSQNSLLNSVGDQVAAMAGAAIGIAGAANAVGGLGVRPWLYVVFLVVLTVFIEVAMATVAVRAFPDRID